jgi:hypothetical protein
MTNDDYVQSAKSNQVRAILSCIPQVIPFEQRVDVFQVQYPRVRVRVRVRVGVRVRVRVDVFQVQYPGVVLLDPRRLLL